MYKTTNNYVVTLALSAFLTMFCQKCLVHNTSLCFSFSQNNLTQTSSLGIKVASWVDFRRWVKQDERSLPTLRLSESKKSILFHESNALSLTKTYAWSPVMDQLLGQAGESWHHIMMNTARSDYLKSDWNEFFKFSIVICIKTT